jgi:hypothetical protein
MNTNPTNSLSSSYLQATLSSGLTAKGASPTNHSAAPSNTGQLSFAQMLSASASGSSGSGNASQSLSQAMSTFHASGIHDQD